MLRLCRRKPPQGEALLRDTSRAQICSATLAVSSPLPPILLQYLPLPNELAGRQLLDALLRNGIVTIMTIMLVHVRAHTRYPADEI